MLFWSLGLCPWTEKQAVLLDYAKKADYKTIIVTDCLISDFQESGDYVFYTNRGELWEFHSMIAPTFLIENFILGIGQQLGKAITSEFREVKWITKAV